jgi:hypothetical protein
MIFFLALQASLWANWDDYLEFTHHEDDEGHEESRFFILNLRALRVLRGENLPFYFAKG